MNRTDKKNMVISSVIIGLATFVSILMILHDPVYLFPFFILCFMALFHLVYETTPMRTLILFSIFLILCLPVIRLVEFAILQENYFGMKKEDLNFFFVLYISVFILAIPCALIYYYYAFLVKTINNEKKYYDIIKSYPKIICRDHHTRAKLSTMMGYQSVSCRTSNICLKTNSLTKANELVGLIGVMEKGRIIDEDYYVTLWDYRLRKIRYGDYDVIEIHANPEIQDYDFVILKVISFFNNEIKRLKPLNQVTVRVVGKIDLMENTKRLLYKYFQKVEYLNPA